MAGILGTLKNYYSVKTKILEALEKSLAMKAETLQILGHTTVRRQKHWENTRAWSRNIGDMRKYTTA